MCWSIRHLCTLVSTRRGLPLLLCWLSSVGSPLSPSPVVCMYSLDGFHLLSTPLIIHRENMSSDAALVPMTSHSRGGDRGQQSRRSVYAGFLSLGYVLRSSALAAGSGTVYQRAVRLRLDFCQEAPTHRHRSIGRRSGVQHLDRCVCAYLASIYYYGGSRRRQLAVNTVYGLYYRCPRLRGQLAESEQLLHRWSRLRPSVSRPPLTWALVTLIAVTMVMNGYGGGALAMLVALDALLRISELSSLRVREVSAPSDLRRGCIRALVGKRSVQQVASGHALPRLAVTKCNDLSIVSCVIRLVIGLPLLKRDTTAIPRAVVIEQ